MQRDLASAALVLAGTLAMLAVMASHPTGHGMLEGDDPAGQAHLNVLVHGLALASAPVLFLGLLGLSRRLRWSALATAGQVAFGFACLGITGAAVASGFVATAVIERLREGGSQELQHALLEATHAENQAYAGLHLLASSVAIVLWSAALLRESGQAAAPAGVRAGHLARATGLAGLLVGAATALAYLAGHLRLDLHGFGLLVLAQSAWMLTIAVLLARTPATRDR